MPSRRARRTFARLSVLRRDAESINDRIERSLYDKRASAKGWRRQMVDLLGHAKVVNAIILARCRAGSGEPRRVDGPSHGIHPESGHGWQSSQESCRSRAGRLVLR